MPTIDRKRKHGVKAANHAHVVCGVGRAVVDDAEAPFHSPHAIVNELRCQKLDDLDVDAVPRGSAGGQVVRGVHDTVVDQGALFVCREGENAVVGNHIPGSVG